MPWITYCVDLGTQKRYPLQPDDQPKQLHECNSITLRSEHGAPNHASVRHSSISFLFFQSLCCSMRAFSIWISSHAALNFSSSSLSCSEFHRDSFSSCLAGTWIVADGSVFIRFTAIVLPPSACPWELRLRLAAATAGKMT